MGTRSLVRWIIRHHNGTETVFLVIYQQFNGNLTGVGIQLAKFLYKMKVVNGFDSSNKISKQANGMGCLVAQYIKLAKRDGPGGLYIQDNASTHNQEWNYDVIIDTNNDTIFVRVNTDQFIGTADAFYDWCHVNITRYCDVCGVSSTIKEYDTLHPHMSAKRREAMVFNKTAEKNKLITEAGQILEKVKKLMEEITDLETKEENDSKNDF